MVVQMKHNVICTGKKAVGRNQCIVQMLGEMFRLRAGNNGPGGRKYLACFRDRSF